MASWDHFREQDKKISSSTLLPILFFLKNQYSSVAPCYEKRNWPVQVQYIEGRMGFYLKKPFKDKVKRKRLPEVN
jgi:hypothetical protein